MSINRPIAITCAALLLAVFPTVAAIHAADTAPTPAAPAVITDDPALVKPLAVGAKAPLTAAVQTQDGVATTLGAAFGGKPTVVIFYRGGWCPFCTKHLAALGPIVPQLKAAGWQIYALSPEMPAVQAKADTDGVPRLSDAAGDAMRAFGVAFHLNADLTATYKTYGVDLPARAGVGHGQLPVPSVFLVAADGTIRFAYSNPDYKVRLDGEKILAAAKAEGVTPAASP